LDRCSSRRADAVFDFLTTTLRRLSPPASLWITPARMCDRLKNRFERARCVAPRCPITKGAENQFFVQRNSLLESISVAMSCIEEGAMRTYADRVERVE